MKKEHFVNLLVGTVGGMLFALGMCMCLLPEWNAFQSGVVCGLLGAVVLIGLVLVRRKQQGKALHISGKLAASVVLAVAGALVLGVGMCMVMVWEGMLLPGILVGLVGIVMLLCLIPLCVGLK